MSKTKKQNGPMGTPLHDVYCRGCHARPSYKHGQIYLCDGCLDRWKKIGRRSDILVNSEVEPFIKDLNVFIKRRGRYVWYPEVYLYFRSLSSIELKRHNIKIPVLCREHGFYAPSDDSIVRENVIRVEGFVISHLQENNKTPTVREVIDGTGIDHTTLWSCMDYEDYITGLGGKLKSELRHRFRSRDEFLQAAAAVVRETGCPLRMTVILEELGMSYPAYLDHFKSVTPQAIHEMAGVDRSHEGVNSLMEAACHKALTELGYEVKPEVSFPDLVGKGNKLLHYDCGLVNTSILVEIDGDQHYNPDSFMYKPSMKINDNLKDDYAASNGYTLIRVDTRVHQSPKAMKEFLLPKIGYGPRSLLNPSNALNSTNTKRRMPKRGNTRNRPNKQ